MGNALLCISLVEAALDYAARGWPVFPCNPGAKEPHGPLVPHGFKDATTDPATIRGWWARLPDANVAVATGAPGPDVLDVDVKGEGSGFPALRRLARAGLLAGTVGIARTPSAGCHVFFPGTGQGCGARRRHHLDFKATGGYVLAAPSVVDARDPKAGDDPARHGAYEWQERRTGGAPLDWAKVVAFLDPPAPGPSARPAGNGTGGIAALVRFVEKQEPDGRNRNEALYWAAKKAIQGGHASAADGRQLLDAALSTGLTELEARRTIASAYKRFGGGQS